MAAYILHIEFDLYLFTISAEKQIIKTTPLQLRGLAMLPRLPRLPSFNPTVFTSPYSHIYIWATCYSKMVCHIKHAEVSLFRIYIVRKNKDKPLLRCSLFSHRLTIINKYSPHCRCGH